MPALLAFVVAARRGSENLPELQIEEVGQGTEAERGVTGWQDIATAPQSDAILLWSPLGRWAICPWPPAAVTERERRQLTKDFGWPNSGYNATHWMPLPEPPNAADLEHVS